MQNTKLEALKARHAQELARLQLEEGIIAMLPDALPDAPTISNIKPDYRDNPPSSGYDVYAWLSFSSPSYDPDKNYNPVAIFQALEGAGWTVAPACLCKWANYRPSPYPGTLADFPPEKPAIGSPASNGGRKDPLNDISAIVPLWVRPNCFTPADVECFMDAPDGNRYRVLVDAPGIARVGARRTEYPGGWRYESGTGRLYYSDHWNTATDFTVHPQSCAYVTTDQSVDGTIYFVQRNPQQALTCSGILQALLTSPQG